MARILIVEDEPINAELAAVICKAAGHEVTLASNGMEALVLLDDQPFDLILADVVMPVMDGVTMTTLIRRSNTPYASIPIIGVTAKAAMEGMGEMLKAGMDQVVTKPVRNSTLRVVVEQVL